jgi:hypothetical protein
MYYNFISIRKEQEKKEKLHFFKSKSHYNGLRTGKEIRFRFWLSEDKAGKEAKRRPTGW